MKLKSDFKNFLTEHLESMADDHLENWKDRYYRKSKREIEFDLDINYDFSADIDLVEYSLERELTDSEKEYSINRFEREILHQLY